MTINCALSIVISIVVPYLLKKMKLYDILFTTKVIRGKYRDK